MLFGDNDSDDGNSLLLKELEKPTLDFVRKVEEMSGAVFGNTMAGGDIFSAINRGSKLIHEHCQKKKYNKRIFLFTNGMGGSDYNNRDLQLLSTKLKNAEIKLNVIPIDFMSSYEASTNELEG